MLAGCDESISGLGAGLVSGDGSGGGVPPGSASPDGSETLYSVELHWDPPTENVDESPLADLAGYRVYEGSEPGHYDWVSDVGSSTMAKLESLPAGTYYFSVTAYDSAGNESDFSNEISTSLPVQDA